MISYLTSHMGAFRIENGNRVTTTLCKENGFLDDLQKCWKENSRVLIISADPDAAEVNDGMKTIFLSAFDISGLDVKQMDICDRRDISAAARLGAYDSVILAGGHVPTQNAFFEEIQLRERMKAFDGILIEISAGTMNSAKTVYAQPEMDGESTDPKYKRFLNGLGITKLMILPHYQNTKDFILDGKRLFEDITYPDSYGRKFYALIDGSYIRIENGETKLFGEAYLIRDGKIGRICEKGRSISVE